MGFVALAVVGATEVAVKVFCFFMAPISPRACAHKNFLNAFSARPVLVEVLVEGKGKLF